MARQKRILVVDDNQTLRVLLSHVLEEAGYAAFGADSAEAALEVARFDPPDLWLVDHHMPGMDGAQLIRLLRGSPDERLRLVPAIGLTGYDEAAQALLAAGAAEVLRKPCGEQRLLDEVARELALADGLEDPRPAR
jgi:CheY-like chemotaxis protein